LTTLRQVPITVTDLNFAPVKGMRLAAVDELELQPSGVAGDREFFVIGADDAHLLTSRTPELVQVVASWDPRSGVLELRFPDGRVVREVPEPGAAAVTRNYEGREIPGRRVEGPLAEALSEHLGRSVRLLWRDAGSTGADDFPVSLMSVASLRALAPALDGVVPDARRFRMNLTVDGVQAWEEHGWSGRELAAGDAVLRVVDPVPRCVITTRDPDAGRRDLPMLKVLAELRGKRDVTFGVWCDVVRPGRVRRGDAVEPA
jgi:uncharacterized protein YcbX